MQPTELKHRSLFGAKKKPGHLGLVFGRSAPAPSRARGLVINIHDLQRSDLFSAKAVALADRSHAGAFSNNGYQITREHLRQLGPRGPRLNQAAMAAFGTARYQWSAMTAPLFATDICQARPLVDGNFPCAGR